VNASERATECSEPPRHPLGPAEKTPTVDVPKGTDGIPSFHWPVQGQVIAGFDHRPDGQRNDGINIAVPENTPIRAADDGVVVYSGNELKSFGNLRRSHQTR
jgi:murein DD-endopeptidase MepM/ murein hydrolase activator NlpD